MSISIEDLKILMADLVIGRREQEIEYTKIIADYQKEIAELRAKLNWIGGKPNDKGASG